MVKWKKLLAAVLIVSCGVLCAESLLEVTEQVSMWIDKNWTHARTRQLANKQCDAIVLGQGTDEEKIAKLKKEFSGAFQKEEKPLIFTTPVVWNIHSLSLGYDIQESASQTLKAVDISKEIASRKSSQTTTSQNNTTSTHDLKSNISAGNDFSLNPFSWLAKLLTTKVKLSGSYAYGRNSVKQTQELWSKSQQEIFSQESEYISQMIHQTNIKNFHLTFTVTVFNTGNETIFCDLSDAYIPVYGGERAYNITAKPYSMQSKILEIPPQRNKDITFRMELDNTNGRTLAVYMQNNAPVIDILKGGNLRIKTQSGKDAIAEATQPVATIPFNLNLPDFSGTWNIRVNHTATGKFTTIWEALAAIGKDFDTAIGKSDIFQYKDGVLDVVSHIHFGKFAESDKDLRYIAFLQIGNNVYDQVDTTLLNTNLPEDGCTIWVIDLDDWEACKNLPSAMQKLIYEKISQAASDGFLGFEKGNPAAQYRLVRMYQDGFYVKKDIKEAVKWLRKSAEQGNPLGQAVLGACYMDGIGVEKDYYKAVEWYRRAAEQGDAWAQCRLGFCYYFGDGVEEDYYKAVEWYQKAAEQGNAGALYLLGLCYHRGLGVEKNIETAKYYYRQAAEKGDKQAKEELDDLE